MDNLFLKYMSERSGSKKRREEAPKLRGPVITISREYGCPAKRIARKLADTFTEKNRRLGHDAEWKWISKEIIDESARQLKLSPSVIQDISSYRTRGFFDHLAHFFSDEYYPGDVKVKNTIANFIYNAASEGNVIIVGRAAESITKDFEKALHIKLQAPIEWRAKQVAEAYGMTFSDAKREALEMDKRRLQFRNYFEKDRADTDFFDVMFNTATMTDEEIIEMILIVSETRGFVF